MDPGGVKGQTSWSAGSTRRRLAAGEAKRGGAGAGFTYRAPFGAPLGAMDSWEWPAAGGAGSWVRGRQKRRRRRVWRRPELGHRRLGATACFTKNWWDLRLPEETLSTPTCSGATCGGCNRGGDMAGGGELSAPVNTAATQRKQGRGGRGLVQVLTAGLASSRERSGTICSS